MSSILRYQHDENILLKIGEDWEDGLEDLELKPYYRIGDIIIHQEYYIKVGIYKIKLYIDDLINRRLGEYGKFQISIKEDGGILLDLNYILPGLKVGFISKFIGIDELYKVINGCKKLNKLQYFI